MYTSEGCLYGHTVSEEKQPYVSSFFEFMSAKEHISCLEGMFAVHKKHTSTRAVETG